MVLKVFTLKYKFRSHGICAAILECAIVEGFEHGTDILGELKVTFRFIWSLPHIKYNK
jgi:hypothetical protein